MRNFRDLEIWKDGMELVKKVYAAIPEIPKAEQYGLVSQMTRAAVSIPSNIAEGCSRKSNKEFTHYLEISLGSSFELEIQLLIAHEVGYLKAVDQLISSIHTFQSRCNAFIQSVKKFS